MTKKLIRTPWRVRVVVEAVMNEPGYTVSDLQREVKEALGTTFTTARYIKDGTRVEVKQMGHFVSRAVRNAARVKAMPGAYK